MEILSMYSVQLERGLIKAQSERSDLDNGLKNKPERLK